MYILLIWSYAIKGHTHSKKAFTLVELLVVVGIIALLLGILIPALNKARESGKSTVCMTIERTIGKAYLNYSVDYNDMITPIIRPRVDNPPFQTRWVVVLRDYGTDELYDIETAGDYNEYFIQCPTNKTNTSSYSRNGYVGYADWWLTDIEFDDRPQTFPRTFAEVPYLSSTGLTMESSHRHYYQNYGCKDETHRHYPCIGSETSAESPTPHWGRYMGLDSEGDTIWADGKANVLWCDMHVSSINANSNDLYHKAFDPDYSGFWGD